MEILNINILFDIGANTGQYAKNMRELGYSKKIISFEPLTDAFNILNENSIKDDSWLINNYAIGDENSSGVINIAHNSISSSILNMLPSHANSSPTSKYIAKEEIELKTLDSVFNSFCKKDDKVMMKIDTQGFEKNVIDGAAKYLNNIDIIQLEMSIIPLYKNEMIFIDMMKYLDEKNFQLFSLENGFSNPTTSQLLQVDGIFVNKHSLLKTRNGYCN